MSDDLRTRIMAALLKEDQLRVCKLSDADIRFMADAVIAELSLMIDDSYRISYGTAFIVHGYYEMRDDE